MKRVGDLAGDGGVVAMRPVIVAPVALELDPRPRRGERLTMEAETDAGQNDVPQVERVIERVESEVDGVPAGVGA